MSPFETNVLRFIFTLDNTLLALIPWLKTLAVIVGALSVAALLRRVLRKARGISRAA